jgi:hypothetical protein
MNQSIEELESQLDDLDIPILDIVSILEIMGDAFDIDPIDFINDTHINRELREGFELMHGSKEVAIMGDLLDCALESSLQLPQIIRAIELSRMINALDE